MDSSIGVLLWQLFNLVVPVLIIFNVVLFFRSIKQRNIQLDRIERKIDTLQEQLEQQKD